MNATAPATDAPPSPVPLFRVVWKIVVLALAVGVTYVACLNAPRADLSPQAGVRMNLPERVANFTGQSQEVTKSERVLLPPDTQFEKKVYTGPNNETINAQIVLAGAERRSIHRPEVCLPGQGWTIKSSSTVSVPLATGRELEVTLLRIVRPVELPNGRTRELETLFCYWFVGHGITTPSHLVRVLRSHLDVLLHNMNHRWAYVIVAAPVLEGFRPGGKDNAQTLAMIKDFIANLAPEIMLSDAPNAAAPAKK